MSVLVPRRLVYISCLGKYLKLIYTIEAQAQKQVSLSGQSGSSRLTEQIDKKGRYIYSSKTCCRALLNRKIFFTGSKMCTTKEIDCRQYNGNLQPL